MADASSTKPNLFQGAFNNIRSSLGVGDSPAPAPAAAAPAPAPAFGPDPGAGSAGKTGFKDFSSASMVQGSKDF